MCKLSQVDHCGFFSWKFMSKKSLGKRILFPEFPSCCWLSENSKPYVCLSDVTNVDILRWLLSSEQMFYRGAPLGPPWTFKERCVDRRAWNKRIPFWMFIAILRDWGRNKCGCINRMNCISRKRLRMKMKRVIKIRYRCR